MRVCCMRSRASSMSSGGSATAKSDDLGCGAACAEQDHRTEQAILEHAEQKLMGVRRHNHRLHGEALQPRIGPRLGHAGDHRLRGAARFGGGGETEMHAADIRFMRDVLGQYLDGHVRRLLELREGDLLHLLR